MIIKFLSSMRALTIAIMVIYIAVLFDVYERYNGIDFWVMMMVFTPLHVLFMWAPSEYRKSKWLLSGSACVFLVLLIVSHIHPPLTVHFYSLSLAYMVNIFILLVLAALSLLRASD